MSVAFVTPLSIRPWKPIKKALGLHDQHDLIFRQWWLFDLFEPTITWHSSSNITTSRDNPNTLSFSPKSEAAHRQLLFVAGPASGDEISWSCLPPGPRPNVIDVGCIIRHTSPTIAATKAIALQYERPQFTCSKPSVRILVRQQHQVLLTRF